MAESNMHIDGSWIENNRKAQHDPVRRAVQQLAKKELLLFAAVVRNRICRDKSGKEAQDMREFTDLVIKHAQVFQPCLKRTGVTVENSNSDATNSLTARTGHVQPTDEQIQHLAEECLDYVDLMQDIMPHECGLVSNFAWVQANLFALA